MADSGIGRLIEYAHEILDLADCVIGDTLGASRFDLAHYRRAIGERGSDEAFARMLHDARREALGCPHAAMADAAVAGLASVIRSLTGIDRDGLQAAREKLAGAIDEVRLHEPGEARSHDGSEVPAVEITGNSVLPVTAEPVRKTTGTARGEATARLIAALSKHHGYADRSVLNTEPIGIRELARLAKCDAKTAGNFIRRKFRDRHGYARTCRHTPSLAGSLAMMNSELAPRDVFGRAPMSEGGREED